MTLKKKPAPKARPVPPMLRQAIRDAAAKARKAYAPPTLEEIDEALAEVATAPAPASPRIPAFASLSLPIDLLEADADVFRRKQADYAPDGPAPRAFTLRMDAFENFRFSSWYAARVCRGLPEDDPRRAAAILEGVGDLVGVELLASSEATAGRGHGFTFGPGAGRP